MLYIPTNLPNLLNINLVEHSNIWFVFERFTIGDHSLEPRRKPWACLSFRTVQRMISLRSTQGKVASRSLQLVLPFVRILTFFKSPWRVDDPESAARILRTFNTK